jgi:lysozyme
MNFNKRLLGGALVGVVAIAGPFIQGWEGRSLTAYLDPVGIATICDGETEGVYLGQVKTHQECDEMTKRRITEFAEQVDDLVKVKMPESRHAALTSFAYNVGITNFKRSTLLRKLNAGDTVGACNELSRWVYAKGVKLRGLVRRREAERELCLQQDYTY